MYKIETYRDYCVFFYILHWVEFLIIDRIESYVLVIMVHCIRPMYITFR